MQNRFLIIVTGYNCASNVQKCWRSVAGQTHQNWDAVFIDDGSTDETYIEIHNLIKDGANLKLNHSDFNEGAALQRKWATNDYGRRDDIVLLLGMDDCLLPNALQRINDEYEKGVWMTYGNWIDQHGKGLPENFLDFSDEVHANNSYRDVKYRSTAPNTFRKFLFDKIPQDRFIYKGEWIKATTESPLMFACLEMCGKERIGVIKDKIYLYNIGRKDNARNRFGSAYQDEIYQYVIQQPKFNKLP